MKLDFTGRGFARGEFTDTYGQTCSIQASSIATEQRIWLGADEKGPYLNEVGRMHLNRAQVAMLLPYLQAFVDTGDLTAVDNQAVNAAHAFEVREVLSSALAQAAADLDHEGWPHLANALRELADPTPREYPEAPTVLGDATHG